jgi:ligand-binding sensor domain-containing protein/two-component sensor histidine kinase
VIALYLSEKLEGFKMIFSPTFRATTNDAAGLWNRIHSFVRISWLAIFPLVVLASPSVTLAQATHFTSTIWRSQDGLPENIVQALAQDREGYLWVGTTGGLTEFDGSRFNPLTDGTTQTFTVNSFFCLLLSHDGTMWAGTEGGGLLHIGASGAIRTYAAQDGLADAFVRSIFEDSLNRLWVGTDNGLFLKQGERLVRVEQPGAHGALDVHAITEDHEHHILAGGSQLIALGMGQNRKIPLPGVYSQNKVVSLLTAMDGSLWVGTASGLLHQVHGKFLRAPELSCTVQVIRQTSEGTIWIGTVGQGLWAYRDGILKRISDTGVVPIATVLNIFEDADRRIWLGTQNGLVRLERTQISLIPLPGSGTEYGTISGAPNGDIWMVVQKAFRVSDGVPARLNFPGLGDTPIRTIYRAKDGSTWIGTGGRGAYHLDRGKLTHFSKDSQQPITSNFIRGFLESSYGEMWIATDVGLNQITTKGITRYGIADGLTNFSVRSLFEDNDHNIWIGTDLGLSRWRAGALIHDAATTALRTEKVWTILQDRRGIMWFGTRDHGIFRYRDNVVEHYSTSQGLVSNIIYQMLQDRTGRFWISGAEMISSIPEEEMDGDPLHRSRPISATLYRMPYETNGVQLCGARMSTGYLAPDDTVWFASDHGALHVIASGTDVKGTPRIRIVGLSLDGANVSAQEGIHLPAGGKRLAFSFVPLFLGPQVGIRFFYRLEGFDNSWISAGSGHTATYTNLPAGTYRFQVRSFDVSRPDFFTEESFDFTKKPFIYQTWWFRLLFMAALLGCILLIYTLRLRGVRNRFAVVLEERSRLAREMHDTVIRGCIGVSMLMEAIATRRGDAFDDSNLFNVAREQLRSTISEARQAVWDLRRNDEEEIDLPHSLAALAEQATQAFGIPVVCQRVDPMSGISGLTGHELLMVTREAIANAGSHANPEWIRISALLDGAGLTLSVIDNGSGFVQPGPSGNADGHYGLIGMRERMNRIGGTLTIHTKSGSGTEVVMKLRRATAESEAQGRSSRGMLQ